MLARGLKRCGTPVPPVFSWSSFIMPCTSFLTSANVSKGIYGILFSKQYSSSFSPLRQKRTSASRAAVRSDTPSPMKMMSGISPSPQASAASARPLLTERALSWPSSVPWSQTGFHGSPLAKVASLAMIGISDDCVRCQFLSFSFSLLMSKSKENTDIPLVHPKRHPTPFAKSASIQN